MGDMMTNYSKKHRYGLATQIHRNHSGQPGKYGEEYGHFGATYGYQSFLMYYPELDFTIAGASNMESDYEQQVKEALCYGYNEVAAVLLHRENMQCDFSCSATGTCKCRCAPLEDPPTTTNTTSTTGIVTASTTTSTSVIATTVTVSSSLEGAMLV